MAKNYNNKFNDSIDSKERNEVHIERNNWKEYK